MTKFAKERFEINHFDEIYAKLYNKVFNDQIMYEKDYEIIKKYIKSPKSKILDAGCGTGLHLEKFCKQFQMIAVDNNNNFLKLARVRCPDADFYQANLNNSELFQKSKFNLIYALNDTLYHSDTNTRNVIINNFYNWLKVGGKLCVHIFNKDKLDPAPREFSQYITRDGKKHALTYFEKFTHEAWWEKESKDKFIYQEKFIMPSKNYKTQATTMIFPDKRTLLNEFKSAGFKLINIYDFNDIEQTFYELYIFKK